VEQKPMILSEKIAEDMWCKTAGIIPFQEVQKDKSNIGEDKFVTQETKREPEDLSEKVVTGT
jgi:hypothetical protein